MPISKLTVAPNPHFHREFIIVLVAGSMVVQKFGGTSVADAAAIRRLIEIVRAARSRDGGGPAVVVSAMSGVTDGLLGIAAAASGSRSDDARSRVEQIRARHSAAARELTAGADREALAGRIDAQLDQLLDLVRTLAVLREVSPRMLDVVMPWERSSPPVSWPLARERRRPGRVGRRPAGDRHERRSHPRDTLAAGNRRSASGAIMSAARGRHRGVRDPDLDRRRRHAGRRSPRPPAQETRDAARTADGL
jgi:hypothetical protein